MQRDPGDVCLAHRVIIGRPVDCRPLLRELEQALDMHVRACRLEPMIDAGGQDQEV